MSEWVSDQKWAEICIFRIIACFCDDVAQKPVRNFITHFLIFRSKKWVIDGVKVPKSWNNGHFGESLTHRLSDRLVLLTRMPYSEHRQLYWPLIFVKSQISEWVSERSEIFPITHSLTHSLAHPPLKLTLSRIWVLYANLQIIRRIFMGIEVSLMCICEETQMSKGWLR